MKRILITRPTDQAGDFAAALVDAGMQPVFFPVIEISALTDSRELDQALLNLDRYHWLVLTSVNGVKAVWQRLTALAVKGLPSSIRIAAIGPKTAAALEERGETPNFVPTEYVAEAILPGLGDLRGCRVLLPRADLARRTLAELIEQAGGEAHEIAAYHTLPGVADPGGLQALHEGVDAITLTSSSTVRNFIALVHNAGMDPLHLPGAPVYACIGPITASTAAAEGLPISIIANEYTSEGLVRALLEKGYGYP